MPIFELCDELIFPDPEQAEPDGLLAVGGDLRPERLIAAYASGIFPWYAPDTPILWWSTNPRPVLAPSMITVPSRLARTIRQNRFHVTMDRDFLSVIRGCAVKDRPGQEGTWLVPEMIRAYVRLHELGLAHSVEAWRDGRLAGGLYGVSLGRAFFGESMFFNVPDSSKVAFVHLVRQLERWDFHFIDCQQTTAHVLRFGAEEIPRIEFLDRLNHALAFETRQRKWCFDEER